MTIPAGQTGEIRLILDLAPRKAEQFGKTLRDFEVGISPELAGETDGRKHIWWTIRGRVRSALQCDPPYVDFGRVSELASPPSQRAVIKTSVPVQDITATCSSGLFEAQVKGPSKNGDEAIHLTVRAKGPLPKGDIRCTVALKAVLADGKRLPEKQLQVVGRVVSDIEASTPAVMFGACAIGTIVEETLYLRSLTGRAFTVTKLRCEAAGLSVKRVDNELASSPTFRITQRIDAKGEQQGKLIFIVHPNSGKDHEVAVPVAWCGIKDG